MIAKSDLLISFLNIFYLKDGFKLSSSIIKVFFKNGLFTASFRYFCLSNTVDGKQKFFIKVFQWLDSNSGPLVSEATALPSELQPLPHSVIKVRTEKVWTTLAPKNRKIKIFVFLICFLVEGRRRRGEWEPERSVANIIKLFRRKYLFALQLKQQE